MTEASPTEAQFFAQLSQELMRNADEATTLQTVVERAVSVVEPCHLAGISIRRRHDRLETVAATDEVVERCDQLQYTLGEGPCVEAVQHEDYYLSQRLSAESRWPRWAPRVSQEGVCSVLSIRLSTHHETLGALNLYSRDSDGWTADDVDVALIYAAHASNAMGSSRLASGLQTAVEGRHLIGVAQGMMMLRYDLTLEQSFELLRRLSSQNNVKLRDIAAQVLERRALPEELLPRGDGGSSTRS